MAHARSAGSRGARTRQISLAVGVRGAARPPTRVGQLIARPEPVLVGPEFATAGDAAAVADLALTQMNFGLAVAVVRITPVRPMKAAPGWMTSIRSQLPCTLLGA